MTLFLNPYTGLLLLFLVPVFYLFPFSKNRDAKPQLNPSEKGVGEGEGEEKIRPQDWRRYRDELSIFFPLLFPKDKTIRRRMIRDCSVVLLCLGIYRLINLASPILLRRIVDLLSSSNDYETRRLPWIEVVLFILCQNMFGRVASDVQDSFQSRMTGEADDAITLLMYDKLLEQSAEYHENSNSAATWEAVSHAGYSAIHYFSYLLFGQMPMVVDLVLGIAACWTVFDASLAFTMIVSIASYVAVSFSLEREAGNEVKAYLEAAEHISNIGPDTIRNWQTVSYFNRFEHERARYAQAVKSKRKFFSQYRAPMSWRRISTNITACVGLGSVCLLGCYQIVHSSRSAGDFAMLFQFCTDLFQPISSLMGILSYTEEFLRENRRVIEILKLDAKVKDKEDAVDFKPGNGTIEFENVHFSYDGKREIIRDVSFKVEGTKTVAIVGETGGGKSTMFKLLCRAYDVTGGRVKIDGQDVRDVRMATLRDNITIVPQSIGVFNLSILDNLRYANLEATRQQIEDACQAAALHKRILSFPNGYDEKVGEKGVKLSGGELQRLAIARALLRQAPIVLLDEATSNLDAETEFRIQDYLRKWYKNRTVIVVAHRLATIANADMIISFKEGVIVEIGTHDELLASKGYFFQLWNKQRLLWESSKEKIEASEEQGE